MYGAAARRVHTFVPTHTHAHRGREREGYKERKVGRERQRAIHTRTLTKRYLLLLNCRRNAVEMKLRRASNIAQHRVKRSQVKQLSGCGEGGQEGAAR